MPYPFRSLKQQRGVAMVVALLIFAICTSLLVALQSDFDLSYRRVANSIVAEQSWEYLLGAEDLASLALQLDHDADKARGGQARDDLREVWAQESAPYALDEGGWMRGRLEDLQGRFNLNTLGATPVTGEGAARYSVWEQAFIRLLQSLDGVELDQFQAAAIAESVADWIDADDEPRPAGAESSFYVSLDPSYRPANRPMRSVSELRAIANITEEIYRAIRPVVTVWPQTGSLINIHTAPLPVLRTLNPDNSLEPLSRSDGESLLSFRSEFGFESLEAFLQAPVFANAPVAGIAVMLGESSSFFLLRSRVEIADRDQRLYSVLQRRERDVSVLQRSNPGLFDSFYDEIIEPPSGQTTAGTEPATETLR